MKTLTNFDKMLEAFNEIMEDLCHMKVDHHALYIYALHKKKKSKKLLLKIREHSKTNEVRVKSRFQQSI